MRINGISIKLIIQLPSGLRSSSKIALEQGEGRQRMVVCVREYVVLGERVDNVEQRGRLHLNLLLRLGRAALTSTATFRLCGR